MIFRLFIALGFTLGLTTACGPINNSGDGVSFKTYNSIYEETTGQPNDQGDVGLIGQTPGIQNGDGGLGSNDDSGSNSNNDGGLTGNGGTANVNLGLGTWTGGTSPVQQPDGGLMGGNPNLVGGTMSRPAEDNVFVGMNVKKMCQAGEIDILRSVLPCQPDQNLIVTMKDSMGEVLLENFGSVNSNNGDVDSLISKLKAMQLNGAMVGTALGLFVCIDHNANNSCEDEEITDLNEHNDDFLYAVKKSDDGARARADAAEKLCAEDRLGSLKNGLLVYHQEFVDTTGDIKSSGVKNREQVAEEVARHIKNIVEKKEAIDFEQGTQFSLTLVESDKETCEEVGARMHGCFIAGTEISLNADLEVSVEDLRAGDSVLLSSGKKSKIVKVISGPEKHPVVKLQLVSGESLTVTQTHPMLTEMGVVQAKDLSIGSRLLTAKGHWVTLSSIATETYKGQVYNFELAGSHETDHLIYGNGIVTGDLYLQQKLQDKPTPGIHFTLNY